MRKLLIIINACFLLLFFSCSDRQKPDDAAARAAKEYYDSLFAGNYACFVRGMYLPDTIPGNYREQLEANASMFVGRMDEEHHGVSSVDIIRFVNDTISSDDTSEAWAKPKYMGATNVAVVLPCAVELPFVAFTV